MAAVSGSAGAGVKSKSHLRQAKDSARGFQNRRTTAALYGWCGFGGGSVPYPYRSTMKPHPEFVWSA